MRSRSCHIRTPSATVKANGGRQWSHTARNYALGSEEEEWKFRAAHFPFLFYFRCIFLDLSGTYICTATGSVLGDQLAAWGNGFRRVQDIGKGFQHFGANCLAIVWNGLGGLGMGILWLVTLIQNYAIKLVAQYKQFELSKCSAASSKIIELRVSTALISCAYVMHEVPLDSSSIASLPFAKMALSPHARLICAL